MRSRGQKRRASVDIATQQFAVKLRIQTIMMKKLSVISLVLVTGIALSACSSPAAPSPAPAPVETSSSTPQAPDTTLVGPVVVDVAELEGTTVELAVDQTLDINVGDTPVESWTGESSDSSVVVFESGRDDGSALFNPGFYGVAPGEATVTLTNDDASIAPVQFTVVVS